ncbi:MAG: GxxExxY protein [Patescibacteria group bacterium]|nr:GxxExxY protein [Patescibacteria group bacterium]MDD5294344.1 GxxExxY protein [Patescibacteria group bacterium]MDD5554039.1 GxxExxY protein [Patescibacteria group bacterium]
MERRELIYPELSYVITGILFSVHNQLGQYEREKRYCNLIEEKLKEINIPYWRELRIGDSGNILDFIVDNKIIIEAKAKRVITREDYYQTQRYLQETNIKLALLVNFRNKYLKPTRVIRIENFKK